ncbi:MAG: hypothetical protein E7G71_10185 [Clostridium perfringens]|nr:hypothetical protein [Clostridium perfringens]
MRNKYKNQLKNIDKEIIEELKKLPLDYWDFKNEDTKELTHGIHTYPAVMVYPISRNIIKIVKKYQEVNVFMDPFMGSGTCLVEGILAGMDEVYGTDLNPLARLISKVKTTHLHYEDVRNAIDKIEEKINRIYNKYESILDNIYSYLNEKSIDITEKATVKDGWGHNAPSILREYMTKNNINLYIPEFKNLGFWFVPNAILELQIIKNNILEIDNDDIRDFVWIAFSEVTRLVSNRRNSEFKMYRMPAEKVVNFRPDVKKEFFKILERNADKMHNFYDICDDKTKETKVHIFNNDTRYLKDIPDNYIDLVVTSPPYGDSRTTVAYGEFSRLSLQWVNLEELSDKEITGIDKNLMGGTKFAKGFEYDLYSNTLKESLDKILECDKNIERAGDVYSFYKDLQKAIESITKKCKKNSYQFWVVGNRTVKNETLKTSDIIIEMAEKFGLEHVYTIGRNISNKVMPSLNSPTNEVGKKVTTMTNEHIVILRKR